MFTIIVEQTLSNTIVQDGKEVTYNYEDRIFEQKVQTLDMRKVAAAVNNCSWTIKKVKS